jgi:5-methylcytosine-specific restriction endonuclease McrA
MANNRHPSDAAFLLTRMWRDKLRPLQLMKEPLCRHCALLGLTVMATEVDHRRPPNGDFVLQRSGENFQSLCKPCHSRKTKAQGQPGKVVIGWTADGTRVEVENE